MADGRFRKVDAGEDSVNCQCLSCKEEYRLGFGGEYKFCPNCGVKFKGEFTKRNTRYPPKNVYRTVEMRDAEYKTDSNGLFNWSSMPRLVIENGCWEVIENKGFAFVKDKSYRVEMRWHSSTHCTMDSGPIPDGPYGTPVSPFSWMFFRYLREEVSQQTRYHSFRLVLVTQKGRRVIRELNRLIDKQALIEERIRRDKLPRYSGIIGS